MAKTPRSIPNETDVRAGAEVREIRKSRNMSQETLGEALGVTFQQVQKYEKGTNRMSISRLVAICGVLRCHPMQIIGPASFNQEWNDSRNDDHTEALRRLNELETMRQSAMRILNRKV